MFDRNKCKTQWLIGIFVRSLSSKDDLINCAGVGRLKRFGEPFQLFLFYGVLSHSLFPLSKCFDGFDCSVVIGLTVDVVEVFNVCDLVVRI